MTTWRRASQAAFLLLLALMPVLNILRIDTETHELIMFGISWSFGIPAEVYADRTATAGLSVAANIFTKGILPWLLFLAIFPVLGLFSGRSFCGWACPEGALFELADHLTVKLTGRRSLFGRHPNDPPAAAGNRLLYGGLALASAVIIPLAGGVALTGFFVAPATIWGQLLNGHLTFGVKAGIIGVSVYMLITSVVVRHALCRFVCAAGLMQMLFGWISRRSLRLNMDAARIRECTDCKGCDRACFMGVSPRKQKRDISCVNCGACIDACDRELGAGRGLFHLGFGSGKCSLPRKNCTNNPAPARPTAE